MLVCHSFARMKMQDDYADLSPVTRRQVQGQQPVRSRHYAGGNGVNGGAGGRTLVARNNDEDYLTTKKASAFFRPKTKNRCLFLGENYMWVLISADFFFLFGVGCTKLRFLSPLKTLVIWRKK